MNASDFLHLGIGVLPVQDRDKRPAFNLLPRDDYNEPTWEPYKTRLPSDTELNTWHCVNYGVITGWSNLVVLDFDDMDEYGKWRIWSKGKIIQRAYQVRTARGVHVYLRLPFPIKSRKAGKIDIKAGGGYVLGPGSIHPSGVIYTAMKVGFFFPLLQTLSEALPAGVLVEPAPQTTKQKQSILYDPWEAASNPVNLNEETITKIREKFRIEDYFPDRISTGGNRWFMTLCPFHEDKHPSFWLDTERQICNCYSCGGLPMDSINLYARLNGINNHEALSILSKDV
jgi:hypothetical protein